jgi:hypothetical protein
MAEWWNGVELWVAGLAFPLQFVLVAVFLGPLCVGVAWVIDRTVDHASTRFRRSSRAESPIGSEDTDVVEEKERTGDLVDSVTT